MSKKTIKGIRYGRHTKHQRDWNLAIQVQGIKPRDVEWSRIENGSHVSSGQGETDFINRPSKLEDVTTWNRKRNARH